MKYFLIIFVSLSFSLNTIGQADTGFTNKEEAKNRFKNGLQEGKWIEYIDSNGSDTKKNNAVEYSLTIYRDGKPNGIQRDYYKSGKLKAEYHFVNGVPNGINKMFSVDGKLMAEYPFSEGKQNGVAKSYYPSGKLMYEAPFVNGSPNGMTKDYYESGALKKETPYTHGMENGTEKEYYENGKIESETVYTNGEKGDVKHFDENGNEMKQ